jgi:hypothetical protein
MGGAMNPELVSVLLISENVEGSSFLRQRLNERGCECYVATSSTEATRLFAGYEFDLVLCTSWMQGMNKLIAVLIGSGASLFRSVAVENSCWWLPAVRYGEDCVGAPALRPSEFKLALDRIVKEIKAGRRFPSGLSNWCVTSDQPLIEAATR